MCEQPVSAEGLLQRGADGFGQGLPKVRANYVEYRSQPTCKRTGPVSAHGCNDGVGSSGHGLAGSVLHVEAEQVRESLYQLRVHLLGHRHEPILNGLPVLGDGVAELHHSLLRGVAHVESVCQIPHIVRKGRAGLHHVLVSGHDSLIVAVASGLFKGSLVLLLHGRDLAQLPSHAGQCAVHAHQGRHGTLCCRSPCLDAALAVLLHRAGIGVFPPAEVAIVVELVQQVHPLLHHGDTAVIETRKVVKRRKLRLVQLVFQLQLFLPRFQIVPVSLLGHKACFAEGILRFHPRLFREGGLLALDGQTLVDGLDVLVALLGHGGGLFVGVRPELVFALSHLVVALVPFQSCFVSAFELRLL